MPRYPRSTSGLLAQSPDNFRDSWNIVEIAERDEDILPRPKQATDYSLTNDGMRISLPWEADGDRRGIWIAFLRCRAGPSGGVIALFLDPVNPTQWTRLSPYDLMEFPTKYAATLRWRENPQSPYMLIKERPWSSRFLGQSSTRSPEHVEAFLDRFDEGIEMPGSVVVYHIHGIPMESNFTRTEYWSVHHDVQSGESSLRTLRLETRHPGDFASHLAGCVVYTNQETHDKCLLALGLRMDESALKVFPWAYVFDISDTSSDITARHVCQMWNAEPRNDTRESGTSDQGISFSRFMSRMLDTASSQSESSEEMNVTDSEGETRVDVSEPTWVVTTLRSGKRVIVNITTHPPSQDDLEDEDAPDPTAYDVRVLVS